MTLDEAIKHAEEVAEKFESLHERYENMDEDRLLFRVEENECKNCAKEHRQLAEWLKELRAYRKIHEDDCLSWISCSERMPKKNEYIEYLIQDKYGDICVASYTKKGWHPIESLFFLDDVVAWKPLPKEYKAELEREE